MLADKTLNIRLPSDLADKLAALAKSTGRTKSEHTIRALSAYVDLESWQVADIEAGVQEADRGEFASEAEVSAFFNKYGG